ncbi:MAG: hypothetical protein ACJ8C4_07055 [Gemmataceae bacterium]
MNYTTIALRLIEANKPFHQSLMKSNQVLSTAIGCAADLRVLHQNYKAMLRRSGLDEPIASSLGMEMAIADLQLHLSPSESAAA